MKLIDLIAIAFKNLRRSFFRTILTIVSMMVGAFLVAILMSAGKGLERFMMSQVTMFASDTTITVQKKQDMSQMGFGFGTDVQEYKPADATSLSGASGLNATGIEAMLEGIRLNAQDLENIRGVEHVKTAEFEDFTKPDYIRLSDPESKKLKLTLYSLLQDYKTQLSYAASDTALLDRTDAIVVSDSYAILWNISREDLVGQTVYVQVSRTNAENPLVTESTEIPFVVAGVTEKSLLASAAYITTEGYYEVAAFETDKTVEELRANATGLSVQVIVESGENIEAVDAAIEDLGYDSRTIDEAMGQIGVVFDIVTYALSGFGIVALVVASIGIANTLMMAVYERTREIGVMKAVGSTRFTIGALFTVEAGLLGFFGGILGLGLAWGVGRLVNFVLHYGLKLGGIEVLGAVLGDYPTYNVSVFSWDLVFLVVMVTTSVALVAGLYPAWRASRLNAIEALRRD